MAQQEGDVWVQQPLRFYQDFTRDTSNDESSDMDYDDYMGMIKIKDGLFISDQAGLKVSRIYI